MPSEKIIRYRRAIVIEVQAGSGDRLHFSIIILFADVARQFIACLIIQPPAPMPPSSQRKCTQVMPGGLSLRRRHGAGAADIRLLARTRAGFATADSPATMSDFTDELTVEPDDACSIRHDFQECGHLYAEQPDTRIGQRARHQ